MRQPQLNRQLQNIQCLSAGNEHALALTRYSDLYSWGSANLTGLNDQENRHQPKAITLFSGSKIATMIKCGGLHSCVLTRNGQLYTWGSNEGG